MQKNQNDFITRLFIVISGIATFSCLLVFAIIFYKERTITFDMAYQEFYILLTQKVVLNLRIGAIIPQVIPLALRWLNCPLKEILITHSGVFVVYYFIFFSVIVFVLRQYTIGLIFLLSSLLLVNDTFYWIQSELPQGLAWLLLYYAYIEKCGIADINKRPFKHFIVLLFLQFFHPLMIAPILYIVLFALYRHYGFDVLLYVKPIVIVLANFCIRIIASRFNAYESSKLNIGHVFTLETIKRILHADIPSLTQFLHFSGSDYLAFWIVFIISIGLLLRERKIYLSWLLLSFTIGYLALICITNFNADKFYLENMLLPMGLFVLLPFVHFVLKQTIHFRTLIFVMVTVIIVTRLLNVYNAHKPYTARLNWYTQKFVEMDMHNAQRLLLLSKQVPMDTLIMSWPTGYESLLLSSIEGPSQTKSIVVDDDFTDYGPFLKTDTLTLMKWGVWNDNNLPQNYFLMKRGEYSIQ